MAEFVWVKPTNTSPVFAALLAQLLRNAATTISGADQSAPLIANWVANVRSAVSEGGAVPLSSDGATVPPGAERHVYVLAVNDLVAGTPNLAAVQVTMQGTMVGLWVDIVKDARAYVERLRKGLNFPWPSSPAYVGKGWNIARGQTYDGAPQFTMTNVLELGGHYYFWPGPNEATLVCGTTTLTGAGDFYAAATSFQVTGVGGLPAGSGFTGRVQRAAVAANVAEGRRVRGEYDLRTYGPFVAPWDESPPEREVNQLGTL